MVDTIPINEKTIQNSFNDQYDTHLYKWFFKTTGSVYEIDSYYNKDKVVFSTNKKRVNLVIYGKNLSVAVAGEKVSEVSGFVRSVVFEEAGK